jgi:hypothetical protein
MSALGAAVDIFNSLGVSHVIHSGDLTSPFTFEVLNGLKCGFSGVFGNNDGDRLLLWQKSGGRLFPQPLLLTLDTRKMVVVHEPDLVNALADSRHFDVVVYGHTHRSEVRKVNDVLVVNPGKTARLHKGESTVAVVDLQAMEAEIRRIA